MRKFGWIQQNALLGLDIPLVTVQNKQYSMMQIYSIPGYFIFESRHSHFHSRIYILAHRLDRAQNQQKVIFPNTDSETDLYNYTWILAWVASLKIIYNRIYIVAH